MEDGNDEDASEGGDSLSDENPATSSSDDVVSEASESVHSADDISLADLSLSEESLDSILHSDAESTEEAESESEGDEEAPDAPVPDNSPAQPPPVVPPALGGIGPRVWDNRHDAEVVFRLGEQDDKSSPTLVWYDSGRFYAYCRGAGHEKCRLNRTSSSSSARPRGGRPLGFLFWCLKQAEGCTLNEHMGNVRPTREQRKAARQELKALPGATVLFSKERTLHPGESDSEPEALP